MSETIPPIDRPDYTVIHGDSIEAMASMKARSVALAVMSPPFADLFVYSKDEADMGNNGKGGFNLAFRMFCEQLVRVMAPGRVVVMHTTQLLAYKNMHDFIGLRDFCGKVVEAMKEASFLYRADIAIDKNPQSAAQRMHLHNLLFVTFNKDRAGSYPVRNDYLLVFQAPGDNEVPINAAGGEEITEDEWVQIAHGVWTDIKETDVLQVVGTGAADDEKHVCPLQRGVIDRCVRMWSNKGELVFDPFGGIGSTGEVAVRRGRRALLIDLKPEHVLTADRNIGAAVSHGKQVSLSDLFAASTEPPTQQAAASAE